jgi:hypothetical protein
LFLHNKGSQIYPSPQMSRQSVCSATLFLLFAYF